MICSLAEFSLFFNSALERKTTVYAFFIEKIAGDPIKVQVFQVLLDPMHLSIDTFTHRIKVFGCSRALCTTSVSQFSSISKFYLNIDGAQK